GRREARAADAAALEHRAARAALAAPPDDARGAQVAEARERRVLQRRAAVYEPVVLARLGDQREPGAEAPPRAPAEAPAAGEHDLAGLDLRRAEDGPRQLRAARADEPREPEDLAGAQLEAHAVHARRAQVAHREHDRRVRLREPLRRECRGERA